MTPAEIQKHVLKTFFWVRWGIAGLGLALPFLLLFVGRLNSIQLQGSMSAYYFAFDPHDSELRIFAGRAVFVGVFFAIGILLILYRGFSKTENYLLNAAGFFAIVAAVVPMETPDYCKNCGSNTFAAVHEAAGILLFLCLAVVAWACRDESLAHLSDRDRKWYQKRYTWLALLLVLAPTAVFLLVYKLGRFSGWLFPAEWIAMVIFAAYWVLKSYEMSHTNFEEKALKGETPVRTFDKEPTLREKVSRCLG